MLRTENLTKKFADKLALNSLNLTVEAGEVLCMLGANGAGKTTTINLFLGFLAPTAGAAYVNGHNVADDVEAVRAEIAYVPEQVNLYPVLTGLENLVYFNRLAGKDVSDPAALRTYFDRVGLDQAAADSRVESYSKGMRQKVGLAIALAKGAKALLLDEPLSGLDPKAANEFCTLLRALAEDGAAVLMATHDLFRAKEVGDRIGIMKAGRLMDDLQTADLNHSQLEQIYLEHMHDGGTTKAEAA